MRMPSSRVTAAGGQERVAVGDLHPASTHVAVEGAGPEVLADALDLVGVQLIGGVDRSLRIGADHVNVRILFLEIAADAGDRAAGADTGHEVGDLAAGLLPDLRAGGLVVGLRVHRVEVLVRLERVRALRGSGGRRPSSSSRASRARPRSASSRLRRRRRAGARPFPAQPCPA